jgi:hypothetical protein
MNPTQTKTPIPGILVGITHTRDLRPIIREPRTLKVGIGIPKGKACYVYTWRGRWIVRYGVDAKDSATKKFAMATANGPDGKPGFLTRKEAEVWWATNKETFAACNYPQRLPFFTFSTRIVRDKEDIFEPNFEAIEAHGDTPTEIDIVFMGENPLFQEYQAWSATELKCHGDGLNALRVLSMGNDQWPGWKEATESKAKYFPVYDDCAAYGLCPYAQEGGKDKLTCKPMTTLSFQLANSIRLGATAYFTSAGIASAKSLFSSLDVIRSLAQRVGSGVANTPMKLVLRPFKARGGVQHSASLELRTKDVEALRRLLSEAAWKPQSETRMLAAPDEEIIQTAGAVTAEFPEAEPDFDTDEEPGTAPVAEATDKRADALAEKLARAKAPAAPAAAPASAPPAPASPAPPVAIVRVPSAYLSMTPQEVIDLPDIEKWPARAVQTFWAKLGEEAFTALLLSVTKSPDISSITIETYKKVFGVMEGAATADKTGIPSGEAPEAPKGKLF